MKMVNKNIVLACQVTALACSVAGLLLEYCALEVRTNDSFVFWGLMTASIAITLAIMILGDHVGVRQLWAAHHVFMLLIMISYSATLMTLGQFSALENKEHKSSNAQNQASKKDAECSTLQAQITYWTSIGHVTKANNAQPALKECNAESAKLAAKSTVKFSDTLEPFAEKLGTTTTVIRTILVSLLAIILSALPFFLMLIAAYRRGPVADRESLQATESAVTQASGDDTKEQVTTKNKGPDGPKGATGRKRTAKKKSGRPSRNDRTDKQIVTSLEQWKKENPGEKINKTDLCLELNIGKNRLLRMERDGIDLMTMANGEERKGIFKIVGRG